MIWLMLLLLLAIGNFLKSVIYHFKLLVSAHNNNNGKLLQIFHFYCYEG